MKYLQLMNRILATYATLWTVVATSGITSSAQGTKVVNDPEAAYTQEISRRAEKIVATLGIADSAKGARVRAIIAKQYRDRRPHPPQCTGRRKRKGRTRIARMQSKLTTCENGARPRFDRGSRSGLEQSNLLRLGLRPQPRSGSCCLSVVSFHSFVIGRAAVQS
jgi:Protein of unknown function (DUF3826)